MNQNQESNNQQETNIINVRKPKRVLHCSDGVYEEYSDDDDEQQKAKIDETPKNVFKRMGHKVINSIDYVGESLAAFLNITTPKYSYEIEQFKKMQAERALEDKEEKDNTWDVEKSSNQVVVTQEPNTEKY